MHGTHVKKKMTDELGWIGKAAVMSHMWAGSTEA